MTTLYVAIDEALAVLQQNNEAWTVDLKLVGRDPQCVAVDPLYPQYVYCGTFDQGLWHSTDAGKSWTHVGAGIDHQAVMSVAISALERVNDHGIIYAGTEPTALYRSENLGETWQELRQLRLLPSAPTWSFPPRPYTSHIRWITLDPLLPGRIFAAIEAGALVHSNDSGQTWEDRKPDGPYDTHTLIMHPALPDCLYSAAGDGFGQPGNGFVQSNDAGETWFRPDEGLQHHYLWSVAADPANPHILVISAASSPQAAHIPRYASSAIYRRVGDSPWQRVQEGLPTSQGFTASVLATHQAEPGVFYAANSQGIFRSTDAGKFWEELSIPWPDNTRLGRVAALVVVQE
jgi:photosystem II stability/assembly factor-like uncharacterized protein